jgi:hypothetical protein
MRNLADGVRGVRDSAQPVGKTLHASDSTPTRSAGYLEKIEKSVHHQKCNQQFIRFHSISKVPVLLNWPGISIAEPRWSATVEKSQDRGKIVKNKYLRTAAILFGTVGVGLWGCSDSSSSRTSTGQTGTTATQGSSSTSGSKGTGSTGTSTDSSTESGTSTKSGTGSTSGSGSGAVSGSGSVTGSGSGSATGSKSQSGGSGSGN